MSLDLPGPRRIWMRGPTGSVIVWSGALGLLALATAGMYAVRDHLDKAHVALTYLLVVLATSAAGSRARGLVVAGLAFLCFDFFFLVPYGTLTIQNPLDWLVLLSFLVTSVVATQLLYRANATADDAMQRAIEVDRLAALGAETLNAADADEALNAIANVIRTSIGVHACEIYVRGIDGGLSLSAAVGERQSTHAGSAPDPLVDWSLAMPLVVRDHTVGVLRIASLENLTMTREQARLLNALAYYAALGAERARLVATAERAEAERRLESLRSALLTAVSHDLRTPLTTIKGTASQILRDGNTSRAAIIEAEADRMDALVSDLLDLSRIHAGAVRPALAVNTVDDLVGAALQGAAGALRDRRVDIDVLDNEMHAGLFDFTQTLRILVNLLDNAAKYSPPRSAIDVRVRRDAGRLTVAVMDRGPGVPPAECDRIFELFYRPAGVPLDVRGHGLGLSIARGLAEAQGGTVKYSARPGGGSIFTIDLPAVEPREPENDDLVVDEENAATG